MITQKISKIGLSETGANPGFSKGGHQRVPKVRVFYGDLGACPLDINFLKIRVSKMAIDKFRTHLILTFASNLRARRAARLRPP